MARPSVPKKTSNAVLGEYNHRCAICGGDRPHLHHIDEDSANNSPENLLPLCPNCHLRDQHNPTRKFEIAKLQMFREFKDPAILKPQFHPLFLRQAFLSEVVDGHEPVTDLERKANELIEFAQAFEMGNRSGSANSDSLDKWKIGA